MLKSLVKRDPFVRPKISLALCLVSGFGVQVASAADTFDPSQYALGDWGGVRSGLYQKGYDFSVEYVGEAAANLRGGYDKDHTARYADQLALGTKLDLQKIAGWDDALFQLTVTERSGRNLANDRISDPRAGMLSTPQEVYGRGQTWRLTQMWLSKGLLDGALNVKAGRFGEGEDFNTFPCDFQNNAFCGPQAANWAGSVWYNWPVSQWGLRVKYALSSEVYAQIGAFEVNPSNLEVGNGFKLSGSGSKGALIPAEVVWSPKVNGLPGEYRLGGYYSSAKADDVYEGADGQPQPVSGGAFRRRSNKHGAWVVAQQQLTSRGGDPARGLSVFFNATVHDKATNLVDNFLQAGFVYKGFFDTRPNDDFGVGVARIHVNENVTKEAQLTNELAGINDYDNPAYMPVRHSEWDAEIHYGFALAPWFTIRPNLQYVVHPGGVDEVDNALIAGVKFITKF
ncbi:MULTISPECIES: carbohydrate porin [Pseudomonas]|uniref:Porin n=1 Tax=Pseudomonas gingeri TaxID=117681 RepID=A0A7Y7WW49_9PSED|nr:MULTISPECIES: carbohydrate porin [Pseudomonas]MPQ68415.1 porin [Pseudomonas sp. MWU12-2323]NWB88510.1 porin [Pseudomonas gingeri]